MISQNQQATAPVQQRQRRQPKLIPKNIQKQIHQHPNLKYRLIGLIMLQCGARPGEAASLQIKDFDFVENRVRLRTLKRKDGHERWVKMRRETLTTLEAYWKELKDKSPNAYLFPPVQRVSQKPHLQRKQVSRYFQKHFHTNAHRCRHTFASEVLAEVQDVYKVKELLGHKSVKNTEIYLHVAQVDLDNAVIAAEKWTLWQRLYQKLFPRKPILFTPVENGLTKFHVGRKEELAKLATLMSKKVNVLLIGEHGIGKSHLLQNIPDTNKTILRLDDLLSTKTRMQGLLLELFSRKPEKFEMLFAARFDREGFNEEGLQLDEISEKEKAKEMAEELMRRKEAVIGKVISRDSITNLIDLCTKVCEPMEFTLIIDDITNVSRAGVLALEKLKNHFHIIAACRRLKIDKKTAVTNFQHIQLQNLRRHEAIDLIQKLTYPFIDRIEDYELYKNHIWEQTAGNPLYMYELIDRYRKEGYVTTEITRDISHTSGMKEVDLFPVIIGLVACLSALRYMAKATGGDSGPFYLIAGLGMIALFCGRALMQAGKRKWI